MKTTPSVLRQFNGAGSRLHAKMAKEPEGCNFFGGS